MKILVVMRHPFFLKNFTAGLKHLLDRGHQLEVLFSIPQRGAVGETLEEEAAAELRSVKMDYRPPSETWRNKLLTLIATTLDLRRYDDPVYDTSPKLRERAKNKTRVRSNRQDVRLLLSCAASLQKLFGPCAVRDGLQWTIAYAPPDTETLSLLRHQRPDLMIVTPLTAMGSEQAVYVRAALAAGIPSVYSMYSWDNLTNKGLVRPIPDAAIVWNDTHRKELLDMHGIPSDRVEVTGAGGYDMWFHASPTMSRGAFADKLGLDRDKPFVLYTCSSGFIAGSHERPFVKRWLTALRQHPDPRVASLGVLIRPHPKYAEPWEVVNFDSFKNVAIYPRKGAIPFSGTARSDYFHSIFHSVAVVGINTSAMVESAIIGRPVMTIEDPTYADQQQGTLHFRHLAGYEFLQCARSIEENLAALATLTDGQVAAKIAKANREFVASYIRPCGLTRDASECWAETIENIAMKPRARRWGAFNAAAGVFVVALLWCLLVDQYDQVKQRLRRLFAVSARA